MEFTEPLSDCRTLANRIGSENLNSPTGIEPSVRERGTASAPQAPGHREESGGEQRPPRPPSIVGEREPQRGEREAQRAEAEGVAPAHRLELREHLDDLGRGRLLLCRGALALQPALEQRRERRGRRK